MSREAIVPGYGFISETGTRDTILPGYGFISETVSAGGTTYEESITVAASLTSSQANVAILEDSLTFAATGGVVTGRGTYGRKGDYPSGERCVFRSRRSRFGRGDNPFRVFRVLRFGLADERRNPDPRRYSLGGKFRDNDPRTLSVLRRDSWIHYLQSPRRGEYAISRCFSGNIVPGERNSRERGNDRYPSRLLGNRRTLPPGYGVLCRPSRFIGSGSNNEGRGDRPSGPVRIYDYQRSARSRTTYLSGTEVDFCSVKRHS